jgi:hypothetical protein
MMYSRYLWGFGIACLLLVLGIFVVKLVFGWGSLALLLIPAGIWHLIWWAHMEAKCQYLRDTGEAEHETAREFFDEINMIENYIREHGNFDEYQVHMEEAWSAKREGERKVLRGKYSWFYDGRGIDQESYRINRIFEKHNEGQGDGDEGEGK